MHCLGSINYCQKRKEKKEWKKPRLLIWKDFVAMWGVQASYSFSERGRKQSILKK